ncbi:hypothetical protein BYT27DRAFT_7213042 [Phlegmacium glaucopus]|nr:hypothetical protein BYT27DRAFT_7213042 [Phlegmacium glaucopus]
MSSKLSGVLGCWDSLISAGTGSGKTLLITLCTLLDNPAKKKVTIIVSPLKRLQKSQANEFTTCFGICAVAINEDTPRDSTWWSLNFQALISWFCVDEAHSFYTAGFALYGLPAFRPPWGKLHKLKASLRPSIPWHFFSPTFPPHILELVKEKLLQLGYDYIHITSNRPNIIYTTHQVENSIEDVHNYECFLQSPFNTDSQPHVLIFFDDKKLTTKVEAHLESCLPPREHSKGITQYYHSSMSKDYLKKVHNDFILPTRTCKILIATSGESVGIDFPNVKIEEYLDINGTHTIDDPDRPRDKLKVNSQQ